jgi:phospholipid transport system substrate-binding protein
MAAFEFSLFFAATAAAQTAQLGSEELVRKVTEDVLGTIQSDKKLQEGDRQKALKLAEEKVLPHIDFKEAMSLAMGKSWHQATPEQQTQFVNSFRSMLVRIYANAIERYRGQTMKVLPVRMQPNATEALVRNQYLSPGKPPTPIEYAMHKTAEGWKIYDIAVEGVSLVLTYRAEFEQVTRASGVVGLAINNLSALHT